MQAAQLPEPAAVPVQRPASPALAPALRTISGETPHYRARFEVAAADGADAAEAVKEIVMGWLHAKGLDVPEGAADIAVPAGWTAADEPDAAKAVRFLGLSGAQGAAWAVEADELDGEFSRRRWHTRIGLALRRQRLFRIPAQPAAVRAARRARYPCERKARREDRRVACERRGDIP